MNLLQLVLPCLAFLLYGLNVTLRQDRIELFLGMCWGMFAVGVLHALLQLNFAGSVPAMISYYLVLICLGLGGVWNFYVVIGQITLHFWHAIWHLVMFGVVVAAIYNLIA